MFYMRNETFTSQCARFNKGNRLRSKINEFYNVWNEFQIKNYWLIRNSFAGTQFSFWHIKRFELHIFECVIITMFSVPFCETLKSKWNQTVAMSKENQKKHTVEIIRNFVSIFLFRYQSSMSLGPICSRLKNLYHWTQTTFALIPAVWVQSNKSIRRKNGETFHCNVLFVRDFTIEGNAGMFNLNLFYYYCLYKFWYFVNIGCYFSRTPHQ